MWKHKLTWKTSETWFVRTHSCVELKNNFFNFFQALPDSKKSIFRLFNVMESKKCFRIPNKSQKSENILKNSALSEVPANQFLANFDVYRESTTRKVKIG